MLAILVAATCSPQAGVSDRPRHEDAFALTLVRRGPEHVHPWWPIFVEGWAENRSSTELPIVPDMDGSWENWVEPHLFLKGWNTDASGVATKIPRMGHARCGNHDTNWVGRIQLVPPGGRARILLQRVNELFFQQGERTWTWRSSAIDLRVHYAYRGRPSRPRQWDRTLGTPEEQFGAMLGVAPFEIVSSPVHFVLDPPPIESSEIERELELDMEIETVGPSFLWMPPRGHAVLRNTSDRPHPVIRPNAGSAPWLELVEQRPAKREERTLPHYNEAHDWREDVVLLGPGEELRFDLERLLGWRWSDSSYDPALFEPGPRRLELVYRWRGFPFAYRMEEADLPASYGRMADIPPFELHSRAVTIEVEDPLTVELVRRGVVPRGRSYRMSEVLGILVRNGGDIALEIAGPEDPLTVNLYGPDGLSHESEIRTQLALGPHEELDLTSDPALGVDAWSWPEDSGAPPRSTASVTMRRRSWVRPLNALRISME